MPAVGQLRGGGDSSLGRAGPFPDGGKLTGAVLEASDWRALTSSCDDDELCSAGIEAGGVEADDVGAGTPTWVERFHRRVCWGLVGYRR
ncbi:hypothetical protein Nepgr_027794 [Nepenthes gracilis]|uniref:Uncharacterized protein n=1 Tax=Nepenthes gracilis TaxID=150966 RepID=A0AAD3Y3X1_NEPGR|nr:hypothetical protein Nepgr_027794 [Nepenthes gracilis]